MRLGQFPFKLKAVQEPDWIQIKVKISFFIIIIESD